MKAIASAIPALFFLATGLAWAQGGLPWPAFGSVTISGQITGYLSAPSGALDGVTLDSGATVHFPPQAGSDLEPLLKAGQNISVVATLQSGPNGSIYEAQKITNSITGQSESIGPLPPQSTLPLPGAVPPPGLTLSS